MRKIVERITVLVLTLCMIASLGLSLSVPAYAATKNPTIALKAVSNITQTDAQLNATVSNSSRAKIKSVGFELYDAKGNLLANKYDTLNQTWATVYASFDLNKYYGFLQAGTEYKYLVYVKTGSATVKSSIVSFKTVQNPSITLKGVSDLTSTDAQLNADIKNPGKVTITKVGFTLWDSNGTKIADKYDSISMTTGFTAWFKMSKYLGKDLVPGSTYKYLIYVTTSAGTTKSSKGSFTTVEKAAPTTICFPLSTDQIWYASTYPGHGEAFGSGYSAVDITLKNGNSCRGQNVYSVEDGQVIDVNTANGQVVIKHTKKLVTNNGQVYETWYSLFAHMTDIKFKKGDYVSRGQIIGKVGSEGNATGPHLHFNIISGNGGTSWGYNDKSKAISPYYVSGFVTASGTDQKYCVCDRQGPAVTSKLLNWVPTGK